MHKLKLTSARLISDDGTKMVIGMDREMDLAWFQENAGRMKFVIDALPLIGREGTTLEFIHEKKNDQRVTESEAVELPLQGANLERLVKEVFNLSDSKEEDLG